MRNSRGAIVGLILVALAALAAWIFLKPGGVAEPSTASADARSVQTPSLRETARQSMTQNTPTSTATAPRNVGAQLDLRTIRTCHDALLVKKTLEYEKTQAGNETNEAAAAAASCPPDLLNASAYYAAIKELALRGDIPAQRCLIQGYFASAAQEGEESRMQKGEVEEYLGLASRFIDEALDRGDWSVVRWLARSRIGLQDFMLNSAYPFGSEHPETAYRMNYLLMLGNVQNFETTVGAHQFVELLKQNKALTPGQFQEAEDWARDMFDQRFNGSQEGASIAQFCEH